MPKATYERDGNVGIITIADPPLNTANRQQSAYAKSLCRLIYSTPL